LYNWRKGIPFSNILNHLEEHLANLKDTLRAHQEYHPELEDDCAAIAWGMYALMEYQGEGRSPELNDLYWDKETPDAS
jgi:hypothetical protein